jgi:hypothetical protein
MIEGAVVAGYLGLVAARAAGRFVDRKLDGGLDALVGRVRAKLGRGPESDLIRDPADPRVRQHVAMAVERAASGDQRFAADLASILDRLDRLGGRTEIHNVQARLYMEHRGTGDMAGRDIHKYETYFEDPSDFSRSPVWVRALVWLGSLTCLTGFAIVLIRMFGFFADIQRSAGLTDATSPHLPNLAEFGLGFGVFFAGLAVLSIAGIVKSTTRRR